MTELTTDEPLPMVIRNPTPPTCGRTFRHAAHTYVTSPASDVDEHCDGVHVATTRTSYAAGRRARILVQLDQDLQFVRLLWTSGAVPRRRAAVLFWAAVTVAELDLLAADEFVAKGDR